MVIKVVPKFTKAQIEAIVRKRVVAIHQAYLERLQAIGEAFVRNARESGDYKDRTGNLRNSIGYVIMKDGKQLFTNFQATAKGDGSENKTGKDGLAVGQEKALEISGRYPQGYVLICVAGMNYAAAVESKGFDVISASSIIAKQSLVKAIEEIHITLKSL